MDVKMITAQGIGIAAMALTVLSFQHREQKKLIRMQLYSSILFTIHFGMLGAVTGCILNVVSMLRAFVFSSKQHAWARKPWWTWVFIGLFWISYGLTFAAFGMQPTVRNLLVELLPVVGMSAMTVGFSLKNASQVRLASLINSPAWLIYNVFNFSIGGILCEVFSILSTLIGMLRLDRKRV